MLISDLSLVTLCEELYNHDSSQLTIVNCDKSSNVCWGFKDQGEYVVIVLRGSTTPEDWVLDSLAFPINTPGLGMVHPGFLYGMKELDKLLGQQFEGRDLVITGHSLGAARATILTALMRLSDNNPSVVRRVCFGEPLVGMKELSALVSPVPSISYRATHKGEIDLVTTIPYALPKLGWLYQHPTELTPLEVPFEGDGRAADIFKLHSIDLYRKGLGGK